MLILELARAPVNGLFQMFKTETSHRATIMLQLRKLSLFVGLGTVVIGCQTEKPVDPDRPIAVDLYVQGLQQKNAGNLAGATRTLEFALTQNPQLRNAHIILGDLYRNSGDYEKAAVHYEAASRLDPYTLANHYNLGVSYQLLNRLQDAAAAYLKALALNPQDLKSNMNLGLVYLALGKIDDAVTYLERATRIDPKSAAAWSNLGVALDARGSAVLAESTYRKALELDSSSVFTLQNLAQNLLGQDKAGEAAQIMEQVIARQDSPAARKRYGDSFAKAKRYDDAQAQYDLALKADPKYLPALNEKAFAFIAQYVDGLELDDKLRTRALETWRQSLRITPDQPRITEALQKWEKPGLFNPN